MVYTYTQALQWGISNVEIGQFDYHDNRYQKRSGNFVRAILMAFMEGDGYWLGNECSTEHGTVTDAGRQSFRDKLSTHIHSLTGTKPRIVKEGDRYAIYRV